MRILKLATWTQTDPVLLMQLRTEEKINKQHGIYLWALCEIRFLFYRFSQPGFVVGRVDKCTNRPLYRCLSDLLPARSSSSLYGTVSAQGGDAPECGS